MDGFKRFLADLKPGIIVLLFIFASPLGIAALIGKLICQDMLEK